MRSRREGPRGPHGPADPNAAAALQLRDGQLPAVRGPCQALPRRQGVPRHPELHGRLRCRSEAPVAACRDDQPDETQVAKPPSKPNSAPIATETSILDGAPVT